MSFHGRTPAWYAYTKAFLTVRVGLSTFRGPNLNVASATVWAGYTSQNNKRNAEPNMVNLYKASKRWLSINERLGLTCYAQVKV